MEIMSPGDGRRVVALGEKVPLKSLSLRSPNLERNCGARAAPGLSLASQWSWVNRSG